MASPVSEIQPTTAQPTQIGRTTETETTESRNRQRDVETTRRDSVTPSLREPAEPNEFERHVEKRLGRRLPRFGADLIVPETRDFVVPSTTTIPPTYILQPGDSIFIGLTGSVDSSIDRTIDNDGNIFLERVGSIHVAGVRYSDLKALLQRAIGTQYRGFYVSATVRKLSGVQVYVTGYANNPGSYTVNSLSTLLNAVLAAGGPASGGSFRSIKLYRGGQLVTTFDLYDLLLNGDKSHDVLLQNQDVIRIDPVGRQVAILGSVNREAIYEARPDENIDDLLRDAGGLSGLADPSRIVLYRVSQADKGGIEIGSAAFKTTPVEDGDLIQALSVGSLLRPLEAQSVLVRIDGEVAKPGNYYVRPGTTMGELVQLAGGTTSRAYVYGTEFDRQSVRLQQRASFDEAVRQLELSLSAAPLIDSESADANARQQLTAAQDVVRRLRAAQPNGRVVLPLSQNATALPADTVLEDNDAIHVPFKPSTVGVFGAVYRPASLLYVHDGASVRSYLDQAGGPIDVADKRQIFLVRANGEVLSRHNNVMSAKVYPGDVIFVPVKTHANRFWKHFRDLSQFLLGVGVTAAVIAR